MSPRCVCVCQHNPEYPKYIYMKVSGLRVPEPQSRLASLSQTPWNTSCDLKWGCPGKPYINTVDTCQQKAGTTPDVCTAQGQGAESECPQKWPGKEGAAVAELSPGAGGGSCVDTTWGFPGMRYF